ncbi:fluoride efflux transporter FluC [Glaciibacter sp. 2TAF33]|uniref:fluoride efflux transporter FluC n=1 Tax=Glaciibacter sp. 2TAF33 TaxID=3233015 RepID=UPI003F93003F
MGLVAVGGVFGTAAREGLTLALPVRIPAAGGFPLAILLINLGGAFLLGWLLEALTRRGPDAGRRRTLRLLLGTGFLGGFTTYSALATDTALILGDHVGIAVGYSLGSVVAGALATWAGIAVGAAASRHRTGPRT